MEGWREMGGDGERGAEGTGKGVKKGGRVGERRREGVKRKRWRREEGGSEEEEMEGCPLVGGSVMGSSTVHTMRRKYLHKLNIPIVS